MAKSVQDFLNPATRQLGLLSSNVCQCNSRWGALSQSTPSSGFLKAALAQRASWTNSTTPVAPTAPMAHRHTMDHAANNTPPALTPRDVPGRPNLQELNQLGTKTTAKGLYKRNGSPVEAKPNISDQAVTDATRRRDRDRYLLEMREKGMSYKDIKRLGNFTEAESTLRGRVRVMTKDKSERVRKPEWTEYDLRLLNLAVGQYVDVNTMNAVRLHQIRGKIPWKRVSEWMIAHGSSYPFSLATCAKKFREFN